MNREFDASQPLELASALPGYWYTDPAILTAEWNHVFRSQWILAGRVDQVAAPGDFFTNELAGEPLLVVRGDDGTLRGMFNVCRHRAARVATDESGCATRFRCRYHGWTYDLRGRLCGLPEMDGVQGFSRESNSLPSFHVDAWGPWIFAHLGTPRIALSEFLAPLPEGVKPFQLDNLQWKERRCYDLACNWKVYVDNYLDGGYHVNTLHKSLASVLDYSQYTTHTYRYCSLQSAPLKAPDASREDASASSVRSGSSAAYWWVFPNLMINVYDGIMDTNLVVPLDASHCRVIFDFYFTPDKSTEYCHNSILVADRIQDEDVAICEEVQRGLSSRSYWAGRYSARREGGVHHFHRLLSERVRTTDFPPQAHT